ncbi:MAG TPA: PLP-dependent transferase [Gaiellaceae bacterium]|nr:PLP-dependent transferase [Gaiellaceae bacterium]
MTAAAPVSRAHESRSRPAAALKDLDADLDELLFLAGSAEAALADAAREIARARLRERTRALLAPQLVSSRTRYRAISERLLALRAHIAEARATRALVCELAAEKASLADLLRVEQALAAALLAAADWQSPSFLHSGVPSVGRQDGCIRAHWNDYKRDRHLDADRYERRYRRALVDGPPDLRALLTSCGMAAFTTVLSFLQLEGKLAGPVLAGAGLYHESRLLLERALPGRLRLVDEADTAALLHAIDELRPSAVFLDSLSNTKWMPVPDLGGVLARLAGAPAYLVVDNTGLSVTCQPFALADESVRLIVFESLLKYAQLGLDRANAGIIVARGGDAERLSHYREHLGTNVADVAVHALPQPDRRVLERRLGRLQRNALLLADRLRTNAGDVVEVVYPRPELPFRGSCLSLVFHDQEANLGRERALLERAIGEAARRGVPLLAGSSFGFDTTRIYLTAEGAEYGEPFVRVAAGTEHRLEIDLLGDALVAGLRAASR